MASMGIGGLARTDCDVVILGEDPAVEVWGHVIAHVHLCQVHVVRHLVVRDADTLLQRAQQWSESTVLVCKLIRYLIAALQQMCMADLLIMFSTQRKVP